MHGAIEMSLGFIIAVVFAIVLLGLAITWIQGMFAGITGTTEDLRDKAREAIDNTFAKTTKTFELYPRRNIEIVPPRTVLTLAGIKNEDPDGKTHCFAVKIAPSSSSTPEITTTDMAKWLETPSVQMAKIQNGQSAHIDIGVEITTDVPDGLYVYTVEAFIDPADASGKDYTCQASRATEFYGGATQQLIFEVKR